MSEITQMLSNLLTVTYLVNNKRENVKNRQPDASTALNPPLLLAGRSQWASSWTVILKPHKVTEKF